MKLSLVYKFSIPLTGLVILIYLIQLVASERVEVVKLHTTDYEGEEIITRLWVVDYGGYQYLRVGATAQGGLIVYKQPKWWTLQGMIDDIAILG